MFNNYIITHKDIDLTKYKLDNNYVLLGVGNNIIKNALLDSTGDNISYKNKNYCELTGLYWIWKNSKADIVGLCHYRRFLLSNKNFKIINEKEIINILTQYDIILPFEVNCRGTIYSDYKEDHFISDLDECGNIIKDKFPNYYNSFCEVMRSNKLHSCNMFIAPKKLIDEYCEWLFSILNDLEEKIDISKRDDYQKRVYGFISERLFNVWIEYKKLKVYRCHVLRTEYRKKHPFNEDIIWRIEKIIKKIKRR